MPDDLNPKRIPPPLPPKGLKPPKLPLKNQGNPSSAPSLPTPPPLPKSGAQAPPQNRPPALPGLPPKPPLPPDLQSKELTSKMQQLENENREQEESRRKLERSLSEMELKLKDEKEKALTQAIKAREEEALSLKMEQALKEMQDKTRTARREQELEDARTRSEEKVKNLERRLNEEREAWVINLKKQMEVRDSENSHIETQMEDRFRDLERRWLDEKTVLNHSLKAKENEIIQLRNVTAETQKQALSIQDDAFRSSELKEKKVEYELKSKKDEWDRDKQRLAEKLDSRERELIALKAQLAMIDSQVQSAQEYQAKSLEDKERGWQIQLDDIQKDFQRLSETKEQFEVKFTEKELEIADQRNTIEHLENKQNQWAETVQELKFALERAESNSVQTISNLQNEKSMTIQELESMKKKFSNDHDEWSNKVKAFELNEKYLKESLVKLEAEMLSLKKEKSIQETSFRNQYELEKQKLRDQACAKHLPEIEEKNRKISELKMEIKEHQIILVDRFEREKEVILKKAEEQIREATKMKSVLSKEKLLLMKETVTNDLTSLEEQFQRERSDLVSQLSRKDSEINKLESELLNIQNILVNERNQLEYEKQKYAEKNKSTLKDAEMSNISSLHALEDDKNNQILILTQRMKSEKEVFLREQDRYKRELDDKLRTIELLRTQMTMKNSETGSSWSREQENLQRELHEQSEIIKSISNQIHQQNALNSQQSSNEQQSLEREMHEQSEVIRSLNRRIDQMSQMNSSQSSREQQDIQKDLREQSEIIQSLNRRLDQQGLVRSNQSSIEQSEMQNYTFSKQKNRPTKSDERTSIIPSATGNTGRTAKSIRDYQIPEHENRPVKPPGLKTVIHGTAGNSK